MPKIFPHFGIQLPIASKLLSSSVFIAVLMTVHATVLAQPSTTPIPTQFQPSREKNPIAQKLLGQWQAQDSSLNTINFIFTPEGKLFVYFPNSSNLVAGEFKYRINAIPKPMHLDVTIPSSQEPVLTIFELTADGQLRVQLQDTNPGKPRPTAFSSQASLFKKISDATTLPDNIKVYNSEGENQTSNQPELEGKQIISSINRVQQAYYLEHNTFAKTFEQLALGIKPETERYRYQIVSQGKQPQSVISTAAAKKPELRSYTGIAFTRKIKGDILTFTAICETDKPSDIPPITPKLPIKESQAVQCPRGSHLLSK
ncbi:type IV pilin-like G/H family protein [Dendronalium sp. ChiSLP03b]|uniref:type IV pilin-like G/H family protein n=1 Tax=Dendronalium sp. ChiSLP03b TaxID=3075381 RepID=UPI002AD50903|nr:type IV pilin-like G/H family protein [Dendronalium sp. ChiSLP03b]MDZ8206299.1 type IV pilin-like G/H family protein [Dendronalium sp. ChiSLP03b]